MLFSSIKLLKPDSFSWFFSTSINFINSSFNFINKNFSFGDNSFLFIKLFHRVSKTKSSFIYFDNTSWYRLPIKALKLSSYLSSFKILVK